jgi:uncharacterized protein (TIGR00297 family)
VLMVTQLAIGVFFGIAFSLAAWRLGSLSKSGVVGAALTGGLIFGLGGWRWAVLLLVFFLSSSLLSKTFSRRKSAFSEKFSKGSRRDWGQVMANGGAGTLLVITLGFFPGETWLWIAYAGAIATVNADTWSTEIGVLSPRPPRLITNGRRVATGTSGGVSPLGLLATLVGAALIGLVAAALGERGWDGALLLVATLGGTCGSLFDSLLGATRQAIYYCPMCDKETERHPLHLCGTHTRQMRGWRWLTNDGVNFLASILGGLVAVGAWLWLSP